MSVTYAKQLPNDRDGAKMTASPILSTALATTTRENATASSVTSLNANCTAVEVTALGTSAGIKWVTNQLASVQTTSSVTSVGVQNYDNIIPVNTTRIIVVPRFSQGVSSIVGLNVQEGLYPAIATISTGVGSVLLTQY